ncbi:hypothetical protein [Flavobacterium sp. N1994]|uniref:hypothetical protein n=1 Tax=Flavobacterium sp. N1994 TaxID=2986827 RepID=UPI00222229D8|nr:hypothetical protein [Flavobacterium sp. N1994]
MSAYEFIVKMRDYASSELRKVAQSVGATKSQADGLNGSLKTVEGSTGTLSNSMGKLKNVIATVFAVGAIWSFTNKVIDARAEYEKFNAVLSNTFQSDKVGAAALNMLTNFAAKTPYQLNDLTGSFVKLVNRGVNPTYAEMTKLGDLASSQGKGFDQLTEALLDAQTSQFERLKEFGINASKHGDKVSFSFKGVTKEVANNKDAITAALEEYGKMAGVAGSMEVVSKTLGGQISNLGDQWNNFLVNVGGQSSGISNGVIAFLSNGLTFLTTYLPYVSEYFTILYSMIEPVVSSLFTLIKAVFGFTDTGSALKGFGDIMTWVLVGMGWLTTGIKVIIGWLMPFKGVIMSVAVAWGLLNLYFAVSPLGWIVMGIMAIIMVLGMVSKYTSGWGESWKHTVNGAKLLWQAYTEYVKANFNTVVQAIMMGIDYIKLGWYKFKEAVGMGDSSENQKMISDINASVENRKKSIADGYKKMADSAVKAKNEFSQVGIKVDTKGISKDFQALKDKFSKVGGTRDMSTTAYDDFLKTQQPQGAATTGANGKGTGSGDAITGGGSKMTHITVNINKLQDKTEIHVSNTEQGLNGLGDKIQEVLLRAVNSVNQTQTA